MPRKPSPGTRRRVGWRHVRLHSANVMVRHKAAHRWWLALIATMLTPWVGPHIDSYVPLGWVLARAYAETPDAGFWVIAAGVLTAGYVAWFALLTVFERLLRPRRNREGMNG